MEKEQKVDNIITTEDLQVMQSILEHYKGVLYLNKQCIGVPFDVFQDYVCCDILMNKINNFLKGE